jgi:hypothetical protein
MRENIESLSSENEREQMDWKKKNSLRVGVARDHNQPEFSRILQVSLGP